MKIATSDEQSQSSRVVPLLVSSSIPRTGKDNLPGHYDRMTGVWVLETSEGTVPIIRAQKDLAETKTLTEVKPERADESQSCLPELSTKTSTVPERDDYRSTFVRLFALETTTKIASERTDL